MKRFLLKTSSVNLIYMQSIQKTLSSTIHGVSLKIGTTLQFGYNFSRWKADFNFKKYIKVSSRKVAPAKFHQKNFLPDPVGRGLRHATTLFVYKFSGIH